MRTKIGPPFITLFAAAMTSCGGGGAGASSGALTELTRVGAGVQLTQSAQAARQCEYITELTPRSTDPSDEDAMRALRNDAWQAGANLVLLVMESRTRISRVEGYLCAD